MYIIGIVTRASVKLVTCIVICDYITADESIVISPAGNNVVTLAAIKHVIASPSVNLVLPVGTDDGVIPTFSIKCECLFIMGEIIVVFHPNQ